MRCDNLKIKSEILPLQAFWVDQRIGRPQSRDFDKLTNVVEPAVLHLLGSQPPSYS